MIILGGRERETSTAPQECTEGEGEKNRLLLDYHYLCSLNFPEHPHQRKGGEFKPSLVTNKYKHEKQTHRLPVLNECLMLCL